MLCPQGQEQGQNECSHIYSDCARASSHRQEKQIKGNQIEK